MNGLLVVNKEKDYTSRDVVNELSKIFNTKKIGHTGTLDPLATGVLVVALNSSLKKVQFLINEDKEYLVEVKLGIQTDTLDITGNIIKEEKKDIDKDKIIEVLNSFVGEQVQEVPLYSAVRVNGKRLYEYARGNESVELPKRKIEIFDINYIDKKDDVFSFKVKVSKGTYIRSLVRDIGIKLGICCTMNNLKRIKQGNFKIEDSYTLEDIKNGYYQILDDDLIFDNYKKIEVDDYLENKILNGSLLENRYNDDVIAFVNKDKKIIALYKVYDKDNNKIKPIKIFK